MPMTVWVIVMQLVPAGSESAKLVGKIALSAICTWF